MAVPSTPQLAPCAVLTICPVVIPLISPHTPPGERVLFWGGGRISSSLKKSLTGIFHPGCVSLSQGYVCGRAVGAGDSRGSGW